MKKLPALNILNLSIDLLFFPTVICAFLFGYAPLFLISFISVLIHECAHIICARFLGVKISKIEIRPFGVCGILKDGYINNSEKEFLIAFMGPFMSLFLVALSLIFPFPQRDYFFCVNLCICAINLLPALPLDGGRMVKSMLTYKMGILRAYNISIKCGKLLIALLIPFSFWVLYITKFNFSYVLITAFLLGNIYSEQKCITLITLKEILKSPHKTDHLKRTKTYTVSENEFARKILRHISYDYYTTVNITKDGKIIAALSEEEILSSLLNYGITVRYSEILKSYADLS
ncbi:MAG: hypothetical protein IKC07_04255 [Clostridia bacterium]|nr:hypothetical protein [Clostridia bacterium]